MCSLWVCMRMLLPGGAAALPSACRASASLICAILWVLHIILLMSCWLESWSLPPPRPQDSAVFVPLLTLWHCNFSPCGIATVRIGTIDLTNIPRRFLVMIVKVQLHALKAHCKQCAGSPVTSYHALLHDDLPQAFPRIAHI